MNRYVVICFLSSTKRYHLAILVDAPMHPLPSYLTTVEIMTLVCESMEPVGVASKDDALKASWKLYNASKDDEFRYCMRIMNLDDVVPIHQRLLVCNNAMSASNEPNVPDSWWYCRSHHP
jgi:hypothetical protein